MQLVHRNKRSAKTEIAANGRLDRETRVPPCWCNGKRGARHQLAGLAHSGVRSVVSALSSAREHVHEVANNLRGPKSAEKIRALLGSPKVSELRCDRIVNDAPGPRRAGHCQAACEAPPVPR